jgi:hypothetical protein
VKEDVSDNTISSGLESAIEFLKEENDRQVYAPIFFPLGTFSGH